MPTGHTNHQYFGEPSNATTRYEADTDEARRFNARGDVNAARIIIRGLIEWHLSEEPCSGDALNESLVRQGILPLDVWHTDFHNRNHAAWRAVLDELFDLYLTPSRQASHELVNYGRDE